MSLFENLELYTTVKHIGFFHFGIKQKIKKH